MKFISVILIICISMFSIFANTSDEALYLTLSHNELNSIKNLDSTSFVNNINIDYQKSDCGVSLDIKNFGYDNTSYDYLELGISKTYRRLFRGFVDLSATPKFSFVTVGDLYLTYPRNDIDNINFITGGFSIYNVASFNYVGYSIDAIAHFKNYVGYESSQEINFLLNYEDILRFGWGNTFFQNLYNSKVHDQIERELYDYFLMAEFDSGFIKYNLYTNLYSNYTQTSIRLSLLDLAKDSTYIESEVALELGAMYLDNTMFVTTSFKHYFLDNMSLSIDLNSSVDRLNKYGTLNYDYYFSGDTLIPYASLGFGIGSNNKETSLISDINAGLAISPGFSFSNNNISLSVEVGTTSEYLTNSKELALNPYARLAVEIGVDK